MPHSLNGRTALITGATGGIGTAISRRLTAEGVHLALAHLNDHRAADHLAATLPTRAVPLAADLRDPHAIHTLHHQATARLGRPIDILISNAGAYPRTPWSTMTTSDWHDALADNLTSHYHLAQAVTPGMTSRSHGRIITIGSVLATAGRHDLAGYISAKAGLEGLTRALARELGASGITVNCVAPGSIQVPAEHTVVDDPKAMTTRQLARQCIQRRGTPDDVAAAITFLATDDASFITGQTLHVDGGWLLG